jgi:hypothetical protein
VPMTVFDDTPYLLGALLVATLIALAYHHMK